MNSYPDGAKVEDAPNPRRPRANAVCCCEAAAIYMQARGNEGDGASSAFPKGKQNREKNWTLITRHYCEYKSGLKTMKRV
jgi:hypothetical protein